MPGDDRRTPKSGSQLRLRRPKKASKPRQLAGRTVRRIRDAQQHRDWIANALVPLIVAVVAFGGGALGSWITSRTSTESIEAEREQAIASFRRDQRWDQYAAILQQATRLQNAGSFGATAVGSLGFWGGLSSLGMKEQIGLGFPTTTAPATALGPGGSDPYGPVEGATSMEEMAALSEARAAGLSGIRDSWQSAYTALDQAISNSEIASSREALNLARALRDKYRNDYFVSVLKEIDSTIHFLPDPKPDRFKLAESLVGVPADTSPRTYEESLLQKSPDELTTMYVQAAKDDLDLDDR